MNHTNQDWLEKQLYEDKVYEGEWLFVCRPPCLGYIIEYAFTGWHDDFIDIILSNETEEHGLENCHLCGGLLEWADYPLQLPITHSLLALVNDYHFMASTLVLTAIIDNSISNLLWAALFDSGLGAKKARELAKRSEALQAIRSMTAWPIDDIIFPTRNLVAHGRGFAKSDVFYKLELVKQVNSICAWLQQTSAELRTKGLITGKCDLWLSSMDNLRSQLTSLVPELSSTS